MVFQKHCYFQKKHVLIKKRVSCILSVPICVQVLYLEYMIGVNCVCVYVCVGVCALLTPERRFVARGFSWARITWLGLLVCELVSVGSVSVGSVSYVFQMGVRWFGVARRGGFHAGHFDSLRSSLGSSVPT